MKLLTNFILVYFTISSFVKAEDGYQFSKLDISKGLSNNQINCILKDTKGFMWFGTMSGLNRYDGSVFKVFKHNINDSNGINDNFVFRLIEDNDRKIWVATRNNFNIYDPVTESFSVKLPSYLKELPFGIYDISNIFKDLSGNLWIMNNNTGPYCYLISQKKLIHLSQNPKEPGSLSFNSVSAIVQDSQGDYWFINRSGVIEKIDHRSFKVVQTNNEIKNFYKNEIQDYNIFIDSEDDLWICGYNLPLGVFWYNTRSHKMNFLNKDSGICKLNTNITRSFIQDNNGLIWIGTDHGGINVFDKHKYTIKYILENNDNEKGLSQNSITSIYKDNSGIIWIGTFKKGINYYHENLLRFKLIKHQVENPNSLQFDDVDCFAEDKKGNLWIGTNGVGLIYYDRQTNKFIQYKHIPGNPNSLSNDIIVKLYFDSHQVLWIGTYFGGLNTFDGQAFHNYKHNPNDFTSITDDRIWEIKENSRGEFWIGTLGGGLDLFDKKGNGKEIFYHYRAEDANSVNSNFIISMTNDLTGNIWFGTSSGVNVLDLKSNRFTYLVHSNQNSNSLSCDNVICTLTDSRGLIWIGTRDGLNLFNSNKKIIKIFNSNDGLPDNTIVSILEDNIGSIWIGTHNGICNIILAKDRKTEGYLFTYKNYNQTDGLQGKEFNERAAFKTSRGELIFGGANGFNIFIPEKFAINSETPKVVFTSFQVFNKEQPVGKKVNGRIILDESINVTNTLTLKSSENVFSIGFAALNYLHSEKNQYLYKLEGFNKDWLSSNDEQHRVTYTNLDPGKYIFNVKASNDDGVWNNSGAKITIIILPPFWKTYWALAIYMLILIAALVIARRLTLSRANLKFQLEHERHEVQRIHDLDMLKIKFFTNISHEFRTPLSLIMAPIEKLIKNTEEEDKKLQFKIIQRNAKRLLNLVNQLLDFRRMEEKEFKLNPIYADIVAFIKEVVQSFSDISEKKNINLSFNSQLEVCLLQFDQDKLEKILFNLLSNAFKFTHAGGSISVEINLAPPVENFKSEEVEILIKDTGIGIPEDKQDKIFEQFFQNEVPGNMINQGSGIGLSITKEFVKLHHGNIKVESKPGEGSCFTVSLPISTHHDFNIRQNEKEDIHLAMSNFTDEENTKLHGKPMILLVEDNEDLRFYLKDNLRKQYNIIEAANGKDALKLSFSYLPDIIISDIMMPEMNGLELCSQLKNDKRTSHIPIIILTAKTDDEYKIEGFNVGADEYISKPFSFEILESRLTNLIAQRETIRKNFQKHIEINPKQIKVESIDEKLIQKAVEFVEKNLSNAEYSVEDLSNELGMSRVNLYKKLISLTGKSPIEFIRIIRLKMATQLLESNSMSVSEVAFKVGFNNPKYFSKYFKEEFGVLPSQYSTSKNQPNY